jgi:hypothetical protein
MRRVLKIDSEAMGRFMDPGPLSTYVISKKEDKGKPRRMMMGAQG